MSIVTKGYSARAGLIITKGYGLFKIFYSLPRCIIRRFPVLGTTRVISEKIIFRRMETETSAARAIFETSVRKKTPANTIIRRTFQELIFRDVRPCGI